MIIHEYIGSFQSPKASTVLRVMMPSTMRVQIPIDRRVYLRRIMAMMSLPPVVACER